MEDWLAGLRDICAKRDGSGLPLYRRLVESMSLMIADGRLPDALRLPPDTELAAQLGVSHITWAKVLNELRKRGMIERSRLRGTFVRKPDRMRGENGIEVTTRDGQRTKPGKVVMVFLDDLKLVSHNHVFLGLGVLQEQLLKEGFRPAFVSAAQNRTVQYFQVLDAMRNPECCGGIIWSILDEEQVSSALRAKPLDWPLTFISADHNMDGELRHDLVHYDGFGAVYDAATEFLKQGGERFIFLIQERHMYWTVLVRIQAVWQALAGRAKRADRVEMLLWEDAKKNFDRLLDRKDGSLLIAAAPTEIMLLNNELAQRGIAAERLLPAVGVTATGLPANHFWSLPQYCFDTGAMVTRAVELFTQRFHGCREAHRAIFVHAEKQNFKS